MYRIKITRFQNKFISLLVCLTFCDDITCPMIAKDFIEIANNSIDSDIIFVPKNNANLIQILKGITRNRYASRKALAMNNSSGTTAYGSRRILHIIDERHKKTATTRDWGEWWSKYYQTLASKYLWWKMTAPPNDTVKTTKAFGDNQTIRSGTMHFGATNTTDKINLSQRKTVRELIGGGRKAVNFNDSLHSSHTSVKRLASAAMLLLQELNHTGTISLKSFRHVLNI